MIQLVKQAAEQTLCVTRTQATPSGVLGYKISLTCRATNQVSEGSLRSFDEDARKLTFTVYVNSVSEWNNIDLTSPDEVGGFYDYEIIAILDGSTVTINSGLLFYDLNGSAEDVIFDAYNSDTQFKGYE